MKNSEKPAYPISEETTDRIDAGINIYTGLSKREYFAGLAMQGICSNQEFLKNLNAEPEQVAAACIEIADELLKQLEK